MPKGRRDGRDWTGLTSKVKDLIHSKGTIDQSVLLTDIMEVFGGSRALATAIFQEFDNAPPGGLARQKIMQTIMHLIISTTSMNLTKVVNAQDLSDEDLNELMGDYLGKVSDGRLVTPATPQEQAAGPAPGTEGVGPGLSVDPARGGFDEASDTGTPQSER